MKEQQGLLHLNKKAREKGTGDHQSCEIQQRCHGEKELKHAKVCKRQRSWQKAPAQRDGLQQQSSKGTMRCYQVNPLAVHAQRHLTQPEQPDSPGQTRCRPGGLVGNTNAEHKMGWGGQGQPLTRAGPTEVPGSAMAGTAQGDASPQQRVLLLLTTQAMRSMVTKEGTEVSPRDDCNVTCPDCSYLGTESDPASLHTDPSRAGREVWSARPWSWQ